MISLLALAAIITTPGFSGVQIGTSQAMNNVGASFNAIEASWTVPTVTRPGACGPTGYGFAHQWIGMARSPYDILQAGVMVFTPCDGGTPEYRPFFNWYWSPGGTLQGAGGPDLSGLSVRPGDTVKSFVWVTPDGMGHGRVQNVTTGQSAEGSAAWPEPAGGPRVGPCCGVAEWVIEGDVIAGGTDLVAPYASVVMVDAMVSDTAEGLHAAGDSDVNPVLMWPGNDSSSVAALSTSTIRFSGP